MLSSVELHSLPSLALLWVLLDTVAFIFQDFPDLVVCCDGKLETFQIKPDVHTCNPGTEEVEAGGLGVQGHSQIHNEFETSPTL